MQLHFQVCLLLVSAPLLCLSSGCDVPAQILFSPDGKHAAYMQEGRSVLIDEQGAVLRELGESVGGFAWSADSATLYFATGTGDKAAAGAPATRPAGDSVSINMLRDGKASVLFTLTADSIWYLALSPDQRWLAVVSHVKQDGREHLALHAFELQTRALHGLSRACGLGICFTGPARLAYLQADSDDVELEHATGKLMEIKLDEISGPAGVPPGGGKALLDMIPADTPWMTALGDGIYFTARPRNFPGRPTANGGSKSYQIFHFSRADGAVTPIVEQAGPLFTISPDGKRILYQAIEPATEQRPAQSNLVVANLNGSDAQVLGPIPQLPPMWPAWRTAEEIAYVDLSESAGAAPPHDGKRYFDVLLYRIDGSHQLQPTRTLSKSWPLDLKPYVKVEPTATRPATMETR